VSAPSGSAGPDAAAVRRAVRAALDEDLGERGDVTSRAALPAESRAAGRIVARSTLVLAGLGVAREVFRALDPAIVFVEQRSDGESLGRGDRAAEISGSARAILAGERTALNFLMRMSGIATATAAAVDEIEGTGARILDTRKTAPGLRALDKYSVTCGGGVNHRMGLFDAVMIKDTHLGAGCAIGEAVRAALADGHRPETLTVEVRDLDQLEQAIAAGAGRALLDNMEPRRLRESVRAAAGRIVLEASGGLRPGFLREVAESGVDFLSLGWLTHSAPAADLALEIEL
jgi:nicotinate-nucleotide pyrophosphorylase (carboxylating)